MEATQLSKTKQQSPLYGDHKEQDHSKAESGSKRFCKFDVSAYSKSEKNFYSKKYNDHKLIAKMLSPDRGDISFIEPTRRLAIEVDELLHNEKVKASSCSLLIPEVPTKLYRKIGFLIDRDKCLVRGIYKTDCGSKRVNSRNEEVEWNSKSHSYCLKNTDTVSDFEGSFTVSPLMGRKVLSVEELIRINNLLGWPDDYNELIIDYDKESIVGLIFTEGGSEEQKDKVLKCLSTVRQYIKSHLGLDLPSFAYDISAGLKFDEGST